MTEEFINLTQNIYKANERYYNYTNDRVKRIRNIFYKKIIKNSYDVQSLINNINKFFNINVSMKQLNHYLTREDYGYKLTFDIDDFNKRFIITQPFSHYNTIRILYNSRYDGIMMNRNILVFNYNCNKNIDTINNQLEQYINLTNIKVKYGNLLKKQENLNKEIEETENIIKQIEQGIL